MPGSKAIKDASNLLPTTDEAVGELESASI
jgi:hypothetical protein